MHKALTQAEVKAALVATGRSIAALQPERGNPTVDPILRRLEGAERAFEAILDAMRGSRALLNTYTRES